MEELARQHGPAPVHRGLRRPVRRHHLRRPGRRADGRVLDRRRRLRDRARGWRLRRHIYGKPILGAESFTADDQERWLQHPATIKALGDRAFVRRRQPLRLPPLRDAAVARLPARHDDGAVGASLRADQYVVGAVAAVARVPGALPVPAPAGAVRGRHLLSFSRRPRPRASAATPAPATTTTFARPRRC